MEYARMTKEEIEKLRHSYRIWQTFDQEAGKRNFSSKELMEIIESERHMKESIPKLLGVIERLQLINHQDNPHIREELSND